MELADRPRRLHTFLQGSLLFVLTWVAYLPALQCGFIWDDDDYVTQNKTLRDTSGLWAIWTDTSATPQYYPLVHSSFWLEYQTWELNPAGYHATNIVLHGLNAILLWRLLVRFAVPCAWIIALIFAVHPVHVESVAWITERKNVLAGMFYFLSMHAYLRYWDFIRPASEVADAPAQPTVNSALPPQAWLVLAHVWFIAAMLSKTVSATLPAVIMVLVWWKRGEVSLKAVRSLVTMFVIGVAMGLTTVYLEKVQVGASGIDWELSFVERCLIAGRALWFYAGKLLWPAELIFTYPRWEIDASQTWQLLFPVAAIGVMIVFWLLRHRIGRGPLAAVLLFAGTLFPALGFFDVYPMRFSFVADHFQYLASIAIIALYVTTANTLVTRVTSAHQWVISMIAGVVVIALMLQTTQQIRIYEGLEPLWRDTLAKNPNSFMAHNNLGSLLIRRGDFAEAEIHIREARRLKPDFVDSLVNLGKIYEAQGAIDAALKAYQEATEMSPGLATAWNGLAAMHGAKGDLKAAEANFIRAAEIDPEYASPRLNLGRLYLSRGQLFEAVKHLENAVLLQPDSMAARESLVQCLVALEEFSAAEKQLQAMLDLSPDDVNLIGSLGIVAAKQEKFQTAIGYFKQLVELDPNETNAIEQLAILHDAVGESDLAAQYRARLKTLRPEAANSP
jgi:tetratricopeptide (TPR) repeat protein